MIPKNKVDFEESKKFVADLEAKNNHDPEKQTLTDEMQYANMDRVAADLADD